MFLIPQAFQQLFTNHRKQIMIYDDKNKWRSAYFQAYFKRDLLLIENLKNIWKESQL